MTCSVRIAVDLLTVDAYDNSERTFIVLGDLVDRQHLRHPERTFISTGAGIASTKPRERPNEFYK
jgi:hypothetical protein